MSCLCHDESVQMPLFKYINIGNLKKEKRVGKKKGSLIDSWSFNLCRQVPVKCAVINQPINSSSPPPPSSSPSSSSTA